MRAQDVVDYAEKHDISRYEARHILREEAQVARLRAMYTKPQHLEWETEL